MAEAERETLSLRTVDLVQKIRVALLPKDAMDERNVMLEIRAGTGGDEAALFAAELFGMYLRYAELRKWKTEILSISETGLGGYKEASMSVNGRGVFARLKFESGVHRVQRVPATEGSGRVHTSAATVAVLPEAEDVDIHIEEKDLRIDVFRASGPGGQSATPPTAPCASPTCRPVSSCSSRTRSRSTRTRPRPSRCCAPPLRCRAHPARGRAGSLAQEPGRLRRPLEKVRTYNFPQRVTDHRINLTLTDRPTMAGELTIIEALIQNDRRQAGGPGGVPNPEILSAQGRTVPPSVRLTSTPRNLFSIRTYQELSQAMLNIRAALNHEDRDTARASASAGHGVHRSILNAMPVFGRGRPAFIRAQLRSPASTLSLLFAGHGVHRSILETPLSDGARPACAPPWAPPWKPPCAASTPPASTRHDSMPGSCSATC
jgi:peptide chain release factor 1